LRMLLRATDRPSNDDCYCEIPVARILA
jgi:hypothetical protein